MLKIDNKTRYKLIDSADADDKFKNRTGIVARNLSHTNIYSHQLQFDNGDYVHVNERDVEEAQAPVEMNVELVDNYDKPGGQRIPVTVRYISGTIEVQIKGFGDAATENGHGVPIYLELYNGSVQLVVWSDINQQDPTHTIPMEGAMESKRRTEASSPDSTAKWSDAMAKNPEIGGDHDHSMDG